MYGKLTERKHEKTGEHKFVKEGQKLVTSAEGEYWGNYVDTTKCNRCLRKEPTQRKTGRWTI